MENYEHIRTVAYFSMEIALHSDIPTYSGGLGVLSGDTIRSAADLEIPMVAVTLCYDKGYFYQMINPEGYQVEKEVRWDFNKEFESVEKIIEIPIQGKMVKIGGWKYEVVGESGPWRDGKIYEIRMVGSLIKNKDKWLFKQICFSYPAPLKIVKQ